MDFFKSFIVRTIPGIAGTLVTYGVTTANAEAIAVGAAAVLVTAIELLTKKRT